MLNNTIILKAKKKRNSRESINNKSPYLCYSVRQFKCRRSFG